MGRGRLRARRPGVTLVQVMVGIALLAFVLYVLRGPRPRTYWFPHKRECARDMRRLEEATLEFCGSKPGAVGRTVDVAELVAAGRIGEIPGCRRQGVRSIVTRKGREGRAAVEVDVRCSVHGGIDDTTSGI